MEENIFDDIIITKKHTKTKNNNKKNVSTKKKKYVVTTKNEFDDIFISDKRKKIIELERKIQEEENEQRLKEMERKRPKTPLLLQRKTIPFLEINKSFQFLRLERWRTPSSFPNGVKLLKKWLVNNNELLSRSFYQYKLKKLAFENFCIHAFQTNVQNLELARILAKQHKLKRHQKEIEYEVRCGNSFNLTMESTRKRMRLLLKCWYNFVSDQKIDNTDNIKWNRYIRYKRSKMLSKEEEIKLIESRISSDKYDVDNSFQTSMSVTHPYKVREALVGIGMEPWQEHAKNAKHLHKMEERMYKTKYAGYQSSIFDTFNQTALGRDDTYERD